MNVDQTSIPTSSPGPIGPAVLDYARPATHAGAIDPRCRAAAGLMVWLAVLSGFCVAVCFAAMAWGTFGAVLHFGVFGTTLFVAIRTGILLHQAGVLSPTQRLLDMAAACGLILIGIAPGMLVFGDRATWERLAPLGLGAAYLMLAGTAFRHVSVYRLLRDWAAATGHARSGGWLLGLGYTKAVYETLWLGCCAGALFSMGFKLGDDPTIFLAIGAFIGCLGYGLIWIWMIVDHARLAANVR